MTANEEYWQERTAVLESKWFDKCRSEIEKELARYYRSASQHIQDDIAALYARFAQENKMTFTAARKLIQGDEFSVWRMDIREYLESIDNEPSETKKKRLLKELNTLAMRSRINVLEKLHGETLMELAKLATLTERDMTDFFRRCYSDTYYRDLFAIGQKIGIDPDRARMNNEWLEKVLATPWSGKNYSQRLWDNQQKLAQVIKETVLNGIHRGLSVPKLSEEVSRRMEVGKSQAVRLVRTEMNYVQNQANLDSIKSSGLKYYRFCATLDKRTSAQCRAKDGKIFPVDEAKAGVNLPPLHPHCRSTVVASLKADSNARGTRLSRNDDGSVVHIPANVSYEMWMRQDFLIELQRRKVAEDGHEIIDKATYSKLTKEFVKSGGLIIRGEEAKRHLDSIGAYASYIAGSGVAFIRDDSTVSDVLEEMYHAKQHRAKMFGDELNKIVILKREIDAQKYLISVADKYKIPQKEREVTIENLRYYLELLSDMEGD